MKHYLFILSLFFCSISLAQSKISGTVSDYKGKPILGVNIKVIGDSDGTISDSDGNFILNSTKNIPYMIELSFLGFEPKKVSIVKDGQKVVAKLAAEDMKLDEIIISASRTPERVKESPITIERMSIRDIKKVAAPSFYDGLENLKEVQMNTSSISFKSINTRGFANVANERFMQLVDGMDNSSPLLNFVLGNLIGVSEIDVQSVELLPGASSALYGANAFNGILFMTSQSPFDYQGVTGYAKYGKTNQKAAGTNDFYDYGVRVAKAFSPYFAAKANFTYMKGTDWWATNYDDKTVAGRTRSHYAYDGINTYGDEASTKLPINVSEKVSRTGYNEIDLTDNKASNTKFDFSFHVRPFGNEKLEIILQSKYGFGNAVYQGANRYYLNNFFMQQHKLEVKGKNFFVRAYTTTEDGGRSYDMTFTAININRTWKADKNWFTDYAGAYSYSSLSGQPTETAHILARRFADFNILPVNPAGTNIFIAPYIDPLNPAAASGVRYEPGTPQFKAAFDKVTAEADILTGSKLVDNSRIYHSDANYNFKNLIKPVEIQVGGSYRLYQLNSHGRIYTDALSPINYNEFGVYTQVQKKLMDDKLKLTGSIRYDKAKNFNGNYSPRISAVYISGSNKEHAFRASFQTGFRNPSTQDQYIGFNVGSAVLLGSAPDNLTRYSETLPISASAIRNIVGIGSEAKINGQNAYYNSFTTESVTAYSAANNDVSLLKKVNTELVKPETVQAFELGYRGSFKGFLLDLNAYYNRYNNFIGRLSVIAPLYGVAEDNPSITPVNVPSAYNALLNGDTRSFQLYNNTNVLINSLGAGIGLSRKVYGNWEVSANYNYAQFDFDQAKDPSFKAGFNTPKHRAKVSLGNEKIIGNLGFSVSSRWNTSYLWQSTFAEGTISEATVVDAQANYNIQSWKSTLKIGATNLGGKEYGQVLGAGYIGQQMYISWIVNP